MIPSSFGPLNNSSSCVIAQREPTRNTQLFHYDLCLPSLSPSSATPSGRARRPPRWRKEMSASPTTSNANTKYAKLCAKTNTTPPPERRRKCATCRHTRPSRTTWTRACSSATMAPAPAGRYAAEVEHSHRKISCSRLPCFFFGLCLYIAVHGAHGRERRGGGDQRQDDVGPLRPLKYVSLFRGRKGRRVAARIAVRLRLLRDHATGARVDTRSV